ncbi:MAG: hypothetical protein ACOX6S_01230 [Clostridia bacterium]
MSWASRLISSTITEDRLARNHYMKLTIVNAADCLLCGHCNESCPLGVDQSERMKEIASYFECV